MSDPTLDNDLPIERIEDCIYKGTFTEKYYFSTESYDLIGPYDTLLEAKYQLKKYFDQL